MTTYCGGYSFAVLRAALYNINIGSQYVIHRLNLRVAIDCHPGEGGRAQAARAERAGSGMAGMAWLRTVFSLAPERLALTRWEYCIDASLALLANAVFAVAKDAAVSKFVISNWAV